MQNLDSEDVIPGPDPTVSIYDPGEVGRSEHNRGDRFVVGHVHAPCQFDFDGWSLTNLGDWVVHYSAGRLREGSSGRRETKSAM